MPEIIAAADVGLHELKISRLETQLVRAYAEIDTLRKERDQLRASKSRVRDAAGRLLKERDEAVRERNLFEARLTTLDLIG